MPTEREKQRFPTRNYPYSGGAGFAADAPQALARNVLYRRVIGLDQGPPQRLSENELRGLDDPFGRILRSGRPFPLSTRRVLQTLDELKGIEALPKQLVFLAADGGHIPWTEENDRLQRAFRFAIARGDRDFTLLISSSTVVDAEDNIAFLQVIAWDATNSLYHFYERRDGTFIWAGKSDHALEPETRGQGPFDSHVNGALVMKELRSPWIHWHGPLAGINEGALAPDDPLRFDSLFVQRVTAERLEAEVVRPGIRRWNAARIGRTIGGDGVWRNVGHFLRQAATATTVNLASSETASAAISDGDAVRPPLSFFLDRDTLFDTLELAPGEIDLSRIAIPGQFYLDCLRRYDVHCFDGSIRIDGDVHFAFLVPEPAFEDTQLVDAMVQSGLMTRRMALAIAMTDFTNPVFSARRATLAQYAPDAISGLGGGDLTVYGTQLEATFVAALRSAVVQVGSAASAPDSPEREALAAYDAPQPEEAARRRIAAYLAAVEAGATNATVVDGWFRLAEHRRRLFQRRPLAEFRLTTPITNIPRTASALRMTEAGRAELDFQPQVITEIPSAFGSNGSAFINSCRDSCRPNSVQESPMPLQRFDPPGFLDDLDDLGRVEWSRRISVLIDRSRAGSPNENDGPRSQFVNPLLTPADADATVATISWNAFPRQIRLNSVNDQQRWQKADGSREVQDEYCEWSVERDVASGKIFRVTFTCEGPEYWQMLADIAPEKLLALYRSLVLPSVQMGDLFVDGQYDPVNRFNNSTRGGIIHLIQGANTLGAEIELAAAATIRRMREGNELTDAQALIRCSRYGEPSRNSDPHIGDQVNALARQRADIALNNPIGIYFDSFNPVGWQTPDGTDPRAFWRFTRGEAGHSVRAVYEVPPDRSYLVGDIQIAGRPIKFGAQIADFITMKLEGMATRFGRSNVAPVNGCRIRPAAPTQFTRDEELAEAAAQETERQSSRAASGTIRSGLERGHSQPTFAALVGDVAGDPDAVGFALIPYPRLPAEAFATRLVTGKIMAYASPDSTYAVTSRLIDSARSSIVIGIYDFSASYMEDALKRAMQRGVALTLMLDTNSREERDLLDELSSLGATCVSAPSSSAGSPTPYFGNAHEKIIVVDGEVVMIQSGNWSQNSIPFNQGDGTPVGHFQPGNRDMGLALQSRELAEFFAGLVLRDIRLALGQPPDVTPGAFAPARGAQELASELFFESAPSDVPDQLFSSLTVVPDTAVRVTPVVTPENYHPTVKALLRGARNSIRIEHQYIRGRAAPIIDLLQQIAEARRANPRLEVRIIVSPKFLSADERRTYEEALGRIGLEFDTNYRYLSPRYFVHCHNKLIVIDDERVLVGSQNWSTTGVLTNREASLLVEHGGLSSYFGAIFDADWRMSGSFHDLSPAFEGESIRNKADFAKGGVIQSSKADYRSV